MESVSRVPNSNATVNQGIATVDKLSELLVWYREYLATRAQEAEVQTA